MRYLLKLRAAIALLVGSALAPHAAIAKTDAAVASPICRTSACAYRFLAQASFGGTPSDAQNLLAGPAKGNLSAWIKSQIALPEKFSYKSTAHRLPGSYIGEKQLGAPFTKPSNVSEAFWIGAALDPAQLRQRVAFSLSQIFVISVDDGSIFPFWGNAAAAFEDILLTDAFANFRTLLGDVAHSDAMGRYLSFLYNVGPNSPISGPTVIPDQNFAREVMQLFTIGLVQLNPDGTQRLDANKRPIPTYTQDDVAAVSAIMTGFAPATAQSASSNSLRGSFKSQVDPGSALGAAQYLPAVGYDAYHVAGPKRFLCTGAAIGCTTTNSNAEGDLDNLLDALFNHPNVGPFIGKLLIQRLVTSNPSPAYVARVAAVFADNGFNVRGDLAAVVTAILLDPEARNDSAYLTDPTFGKIREPILRVAQLLRLLGATPFSYADAAINFQTFELSSATETFSGFAQYPFRAPTVFNFYSPSYTPPASPLASASSPLVAPEMQILTSATVAQIDTIFTYLLAKGGAYDQSSSYDGYSMPPHWAFRFNYTRWLQLLASDQTGAALVGELDREFMSGQMSADLRANLMAEIAAFKGYEARVQIGQAIRVLIATPEYLVEK